MEITKIREGGFGREDMNEIALKLNQLIIAVNHLMNPSSGKSLKGDPSTEANILSFSVGDSLGVITGTNILVTIPTGTIVTALTPGIVTSPFSTVFPASFSAENFTSPVTYTVTAQDKVTTKTYTVTVVEK